ncbi:Ankyrin repeat-containing domain [Balamuthia mandrillaris]
MEPGRETTGKKCKVGARTKTRFLSLEKKMNWENNDKRIKWMEGPQKREGCLQRIKLLAGRRSMAPKTNEVSGSFLIDELLPDELLCLSLRMRPTDSMAAAADLPLMVCLQTSSLQAHVFLALGLRYVATLQWTELQFDSSPLNMIDICDDPASRGNLEVLQWASGNGFPWSSDTTADRTAVGGHLAVLKWAREQ